MAMKVFKNNFEPIQYELQDQEGNKRVITQKTRMTADVADKIEDFAYKNKDLSSSQRIIQQLILIFGEPEDFWLGFDISFLGDILRSFSEDSSKKK
jgi:uncharacterized protein YeeX (DUF496 family)